MHLLRKIDNNLEIYLMNLLLGNIVCLVFIQVIMRYILQHSLSWSEDLVRWSFIWFLWVGVSYGFKTRKHISVTVALNLLPNKVKNWVSLIVNAIVLWTMISLFYYGTIQVYSPIIQNQSSVVLYWPFTDVKVGMVWLYLSLPFGSLLGSYRLLINIIEDASLLFGRNTNKENKYIRT
ncbi:TRAP transporter small permease [Aeromonas caviae]|uniref:TRAP transporter small permease n=1 Tax=Aeromonas caviae TaxID=648 RepID=UPI003F7479F0